MLGVRTAQLDNPPARDGSVVERFTELRSRDRREVGQRKA